MGNIKCEVYELDRLKFKKNKLTIRCYTKDTKYKSFNLLDAISPLVLFENRKVILDEYEYHNENMYPSKHIYLYRRNIYFNDWDIKNDISSEEDLIHIYTSGDNYLTAALYIEMIKVIRLVESLATHYEAAPKNRSLCILKRNDGSKVTIPFNVMNGVTYIDKTYESRKSTFYHMKIFVSELSEWKFRFEPYKIQYYILYKKNNSDTYVRIKPFRRMRDIIKYIHITEDITTKYHDGNKLLCIFPIDKL